MASETSRLRRSSKMASSGRASASRRSRAPTLRLVIPPPKESERNAPSADRPTCRKPKRRLPPEVLTDAEVRALMDACGRFTPIGLRDRALIALIYRTGLRINEAVSLYPKDLDLREGTVCVLNGKGGRARTVGIDVGAATVIERWLATRLSLGLNGLHTVFCSLRGKPMATAYIRVLLKRLAARAGIEKRVHAHGLRHTHAAQLRAEGVDIAIISKQLGHASIATTARYLDHLAPRAVIEAMRRRNWKGA